jgi:hypothetical protein
MVETPPEQACHLPSRNFEPKLYSCFAAATLSEHNRTRIICPMPVTGT